MTENSAIAMNKLLSLVNGMETFAAIVDLDGTLIFSNTKSQLKVQDAGRKKFWDYLWWNYDKKVQIELQQDCIHAAKGDYICREIQMVSPQGLHWIKLNIQPVLDEKKIPLFLLVEGNNIDDQKQIEQYAAHQKEFHENLIDHFNVPAFVINSHHQVISWNIACEILTGLKASEVIGSNRHWQGFYDSKRACLCDLVLDENYQQHLELYRAHQAHPFVEDGKKTKNWCDLPSGKHLYLDIDACPIRDNNGKIIAVIEVLNDITEKTMSEQALNESEQKYRTLFEKSADAFLILEKGKFIDCNLATVKMLGYQNKDDFLNTHPSQLSPTKQADGRDSFEKADEMIAMAIAHGGHRFEWNYLRKNNEVFPVEVLLTPITYGEKKIIHVVWRDITDRKQTEQQLQLIAHYDILTQLPNRSLFIDRFNQAISLSKRSKRMLAVCFLDLDNFKPVNDGYGHSVGDKLLVEVAKRISSCIREGDSVSRQGGDEFALLLCNLDTYRECEQLLLRIHTKLDTPYLIEGHVHKISVSSGMTIYPDDNSDLDTLLRHADQAMYQAKLAGKNKYHFFNIKDDADLVKKSSLVHRIRQALSNNELFLYYQPKVNMKTGYVFGVEALMRWNHPEKGLISPLEFLPKIENTDLEIEIGGWVIQQAVKQLNHWLQQEIEIEISINISSHHLQSTVFYEQINAALAEFPSVNSQHLQLEILESSALGDINAISHIIKRCQNELGVNVALDDFGTGYSSLTHLKELTANIIKIDQSFIRDMLDDPSDYTIISGVIRLTEAFGRKVIAEGVETTEQGLMLLAMGCNAAQGYGIAKPMPSQDLPYWLNNYMPNNEWETYANKRHTKKEHAIKLFRLTIAQWQKDFEKNIHATSGNAGRWPILKRTKCHCGIWIKRAKQEKLFERKWIKKLEIAHNAMHDVADDLFNKYQKGEIDIARNKLKGFQKAAENMLNILGQCE